MAEVKKTAAKAAPKKPAVKKAATKKVAPKTEVLLQYQYQEVTVAEIEKRVLAQYKKDKTGEDAKTVKIYVKPEENTAYYVVNDKFRGSVALYA